MSATRPTRVPPRPLAGAGSSSTARRASYACRTSRTSTCCSRWIARTCAGSGRSRRRVRPRPRRGCCASSIPPPPARPTSTCPTPTTAARRGSRRCSTRSRPRAVDSSLSSAVEAATGRAVRSAQRVGGGDINDAYKVQFDDESFAFVKPRAGVAPGEYAAEAAGLRWLAEPGGLRVPEVLGVSDDVLVLDWVDEGSRGDPAAFGAGLAEIHAAGADEFGAPPAPGDSAPAHGASRGAASPMRLGSLSLPNDPT